MLGSLEADIFYHILKRVRRGEEEEGESGRLPSEHDLAREFSVTRITVRNIYLTLEEMGLVRAKQGKGRFAVKMRKTISLNLSGESSFTDKMREAGLALETRVVACKYVRCGPRMLASLGADESDRVFRIGRLRIVEGTPVALHVSYFLADEFPDLVADAEAHPSIFAYFRSKGIERFASSGGVLSVAFPTRNEVRLLGIGYLVPLLTCASDTLDADTGRVLQVSRIFYRSDAFEYRL
jgi:GntR family transcriptional regulator